MYGCALFVILLVASLLHEWRRRRRLQEESSIYSHSNPPTSSSFLSTLCALHLPCLWRILCVPYYSTASANSRIITLYRHAAAALSGLIIGAAMAFYQLLLTDVIDTVWTASALILLTPAWAVLLVPPALLCLAACLMSYLPHGHMALFIKMVTTTTSTAVEMEEEVGLWRGAVGTAVVSIIAIASGGSAGPEGPVLAIGGAISLAVHSLLGATTSDKAVDGSGSVDPTRTPPPLKQQRSHRAENGGGAVAAPSHNGGLSESAALIGGCCSLAATLGNPLRGCILAMELPHLYGSIKRGETLPFALIASCFAYLSHTLLKAPFGIEDTPLLPPTACTLYHLPLALPIGLSAGILSYLFVRFKLSLDALPYTTIPRSLVFGFLVGFIALILPETLMWGEHRLGILAAEMDDGQAYLATISPGYSASLGFAKLVATVLTIASGYPGGVVYALLFSGYMLGPKGWQILIHAIPRLAALDDVSTMDDYVGPPSPRGISAEVCAQALGASLLAGVLRCPLGATLLLGWGSADDDNMVALLLLSCFISVAVNPRSLSGQVDD